LATVLFFLKLNN